MKGEGIGKGCVVGNLSEEKQKQKLRTKKIKKMKKKKVKSEFLAQTYKIVI